jgi:uncharacterized membrane protein YedE/YeeE
VGLKSVSGERISIPARPRGSGMKCAAGGTIFRLGWALTGACPGPLFALIGNGVSIVPTIYDTSIADAELGISP